MAKVELKNVNLEFPITFGKSFRADVLEKIGKDKEKFPFYSALKEINLSLSDGQKVGILGTNGSGKTSLLKVISGIYMPNSGEIDIRGSITTLIGLTTGIDPEQTGYDNIFLISYLRGYKTEEIEKKLDEIIEFSELGESIFKPMRTYSSGMIARLSSSIFVKFDSDILVLDEFISTGDKDYRDKLTREMINKIEKTKIVIFASHDLTMVNKICNSKYKMVNGQITKF